MRDDLPRSPYVAEWQALEERVEAGEPLVSLEPAIDRAPVDEDERAALWLAAWARAKRRREPDAFGRRLVPVHD